MFEDSPCIVGGQDLNPSVLYLSENTVGWAEQNKPRQHVSELNLVCKVNRIN